MHVSSVPGRGEADHAVSPSPEECIGMVWEITMNAWGVSGDSDAQPVMQKDVFRRGRLRARPSSGEKK
jgi:hypothetical protein